MVSCGWPATACTGYDGYSLKPYRHEPGDPNSLSDDSVRVVFRDRAGILWVGTAFGGLDRLDPAQDTFTHYRHEPGNERSLSNNAVTCIYQDRSGALWIGTNGGLDRLDPATGSLHPLPAQSPGCRQPEQQCSYVPFSKTARAIFGSAPRRA